MVGYEGADIGHEPETAVPVPVDSLLEGDSPRLNGVSEGHARLLAESAAELPPIVVHRQTMRVIDGLHRLRAARIGGLTVISVRFFDGTAEDAFVLGVKANVHHGLPLSLADRKAAAERILRTHPHWSDRAIASVVRLSATTMAAIRERCTTGAARVNARVGRDGRVRPIDASHGRKRAGEVLRTNPNATLREISAEAGISLNTARDVRDRVRRGENPILSRRRGPETVSGVVAEVDVPRAPVSAAVPVVPPKIEVEKLLGVLRRDPSLRFAEKGRLLLRILDSHAVAAAHWGDLIDTVPPHCTQAVADLAVGCAQSWHEFAEELKNRRAESA